MGGVCSVVGLPQSLNIRCKLSKLDGYDRRNETCAHQKADMESSERAWSNGRKLRPSDKPTSKPNHAIPNHFKGGEITRKRMTPKTKLAITLCVLIVAVSFVLAMERIPTPSPTWPGTNIPTYLPKPSTSLSSLAAGRIVPPKTIISDSLKVLNFLGGDV